jgi:hypothetical protein
MRPAAGEVVIGDLVVAVQVPPNVPAREYTIEAAYWDPERNNWVYPGTLGDNFAGGTTATTRIAAEVRLKYSAKATRWRIHARATQPPGSWGDWREFTWQSAPAPDRAAPAASAKPEPTPVTTPTNTANPAAGEAGNPGMMVPGTTTTQPGQPATGTPRTAPGSGQPDTRTAPPTPPGTNVPAVQQPPGTTVPAVQQPPATGLPAVQQPPGSTPPGAVPPDTRTAPPPPAGTNVPAVQQPPTTTVPAVQQPPATSVPAVQQPPATGLPAVQKPPAAALPQIPRLPTIPNLPFRLPRTLPAGRSGSTSAPPAATQPSGARSTQAPGSRKTRFLSATRLAVWDGKPMPASNQRVYVSGPVDVDWARKQLQWWFRGLTTAPTAAPGKWRWELSRAPFGEFAAWKPAPGLGYAGQADGVQFFINLNPYAPRPSGWTPVVEAGLQPEPTVAQPGYTPPPTFSQHLDVPLDLLGGTPGSRGQRGSSQPLPQKVPVALSLYVRVVPLDAAGNDADLPSNAVELRFGPAEKAPPFDMNPKQWPVVSYVSYRPVQGYTSDWQCWVEASKDITAPDFFGAGVDPGTSDGTVVLFKKGTSRNVCKDDDSNIVDDFVDAVGGFFEMIGDFADWVSKTYSNLKSAVASKLCGGNAACEFAVQTGLNVALTALGMPPDLPDFEQLQAMGEGYLLDAVAQQVATQTGYSVTGDAAKLALQEFIAKGKEAMQGGGGGSSPWIPDDSKQYKPLLLTLAVSNPSTTGATPAMYMEVSEPGGSRYKPRTVAVPSQKPATSVNVSVSLEPVKDPKAWMELLPSDDDIEHAITKPDVIDAKIKQATADLQAWRTKYLTGGVNLQAALKLPPFVYKVAYKTQCYADKPMCTVQ